MKDWFANSLATVLIPDQEWKKDLLKDYLLGKIDLEMLKFEIEIQQMINR